jgi:hypothetical protein
MIINIQIIQILYKMNNQNWQLLAASKTITIHSS